MNTKLIKLILANLENICIAAGIFCMLILSIAGGAKHGFGGLLLGLLTGGLISSLVVGFLLLRIQASRDTAEIKVLLQKISEDNNKS